MLERPAKTRQDKKKDDYFMVNKKKRTNAEIQTFSNSRILEFSNEIQLHKYVDDSCYFTGSHSQWLPHKRLLERESPQNVLDGNKGLFLGILSQVRVCVASGSEGVRPCDPIDRMEDLIDRVGSTVAPFLPYIPIYTYTYYILHHTYVAVLSP